MTIYVRNIILSLYGFYANSHSNNNKIIFRKKFKYFILISFPQTNFYNKSFFHF